MAESNDKNTRAAELEKQKQLALESFLNNSVRFFNADVEIVESLKELTQAFVAQAKKDPGALFSDKGHDIEALFTKLTAKSEGGDTGIAGHDIVGGNWVDDLGGFIEKVGKFLDGEKKVFLAILLLIFCHDTACECICEFIKSE
jgi:hypothetical protein